MSCVDAGVQIMTQAITDVIASELRNILLRKRNRMTVKRVWTKPWITWQQSFGAAEASDERPAGATFGYGLDDFLRMSHDKFVELLGKVEERLQRMDTFMRQAMPAALKLEVTLRYLATGDSFMALGVQYGVPKSTISRFLPDVCNAICDALKQYVLVPDTVDEWKAVQAQFEDRWNFPGCCGALGARQVVIRNPVHTKGTYGIVLMAVVDADYCFTFTDVGGGTCRSRDDSTAFDASALDVALRDGTLSVPPDGVFVADDDVFPARTGIVKPYPHSGRLTARQTVFNRRLYRAGRVAENAFGILTSRFRIYDKPIPVQPATVEKIVEATCALHNWLCRTTCAYVRDGDVDLEDPETGCVRWGGWRSHMEYAGLVGVTRASGGGAGERRESYYAEHFMDEGAGPHLGNIA